MGILYSVFGVLFSFSVNYLMRFWLKKIFGFDMIGRMAFYLWRGTTLVTMFVVKGEDNSEKVGLTELSLSGQDWKMFCLFVREREREKERGREEWVNERTSEI